MKILVDTSVWSHALRRKTKIQEKTEFLEELIENDEEIYLIGIILQEILTSIKKGKLFNEIKDTLKSYKIIEPKIEDYICAAELNTKLIKKGIQCTSIDILIAVICINYNLFLVTFDNDFKKIKDNSNLKIINHKEYRKILIN